MPDKIINGRPWNKGDKYKTFIEGKKTETFPNEWDYNEEWDTPAPPPPSWQEIESCKVLDHYSHIDADFTKLQQLPVKENVRSFAGNKIIHHFFTKEMLKTRYKGGKTLEEKYTEDPMKVWKKVCKMDRRKAYPPTACDVFELNRAITFFKPSIAKHIYYRYGATKVFDPCCGWGSRLLGALSLGIDYHGCDTNTALHPIYNKMTQDLPHDSEVWITKDDCLKRLKVLLDNDMGYEYDCVLTSPPYANLEVYPEMTPWESEEIFYKKFLMPMIARCYKLVIKGGVVCINISPKMYDDIMKLGFPPCHEAVDFLQQKNVKQWGEGKGKQDFIYVWRKS